MRTTVDALLDGRVIYEQPVHGYRVALEAPLLARFAIEGASRPASQAIDLGAGCGAIGFMLAKTGWATRVASLELNAAHAAIATRNAQANGLADVVRVVHGDVGTVSHDTLPRADLIVANPPWFEVGDGGTSPVAERAASRAFIRGSLADFVRLARARLAPRGRVTLSMPASRSIEVFATLAAAGLHPKRLRFVHPRMGRDAQILFVEAKPGKPGGVRIEAPLVVRGAGEEYTDETRDALRGRWPSPGTSVTARA